jgi:hypothetical protein
MAKKWMLLIPVVLLACMSLSIAAEDPQPEEGLDTLTPVDPKGHVDQTKIIKEDYLYIIGKHKIDIKRKSCDIKEVTYGEQDSEFQAGVTARDDGKYTIAAYHFVKALENLKGKTRTAWPAEYCNYQIGNALYLNGMYSGYKGKTGTIYQPPAEYFKLALAANPRSRFLPDIVSKIPYCLGSEETKMEGGDAVKLTDAEIMAKLTDAETSIKDSAAKLKAFRDEGIAISPAYADIADKAAAQLAIADAKILEKKTQRSKDMSWQDVSDRWHLARTKSDKFPDLQAEAVDGELQAMVNMKNYDGVIAEAQTLIDKYKQTGDSKVLPLLPGAYTALGKSYLGKASDFEGKKNQQQALNNYAEARWQFINVVAQFFDKDEYVANAHFLAGICYERLKDVEPDAAEKAQRHWKLVVQNFPRSSFKDLAEQKLAESGGAPAPEKKDEGGKKDEKKDEKKDPAKAPKTEPKKG